MTPKVYGYQHIIYLIVTIALNVGVILFVKKKYNTEKGHRITAIILGSVLMLCLIANRVSQVYYKNNAMLLIPDTFCGFSSLFFALVMIFGKRDNAALQFIAFSSLIGGAVSVIYPDYLGQNASFFYLPTITGLLHHSIQVFCSTFVLATGYLKLKMNRWASLPIGLAFFMTYGAFLSDALGKTNAMNLGKPLIENTILTWYFVGALMILIYTAVLLIIDYKTMPPENRFITKVKKRLFKKNDTNTPH